MVTNIFFYFEAKGKKVNNWVFLLIKLSFLLSEMEIIKKNLGRENSLCSHDCFLFFYKNINFMDK